MNAWDPVAARRPDPLVPVNSGVQAAGGAVLMAWGLVCMRLMIRSSRSPRLRMFAEIRRGTAA